MNNSTLTMMKKFPILLLFATLMGIQTGVAYTIKCPTPDSISVKQVRDHYEYSAKVKGYKKMTMVGSHKENLDLLSYSLEAASSSRDNRLFCTYADPNGETLNLVTFLKKGSTCTVTYPKGHKHPEISYFKCKK